MFAPSISSSLRARGLALVAVLAPFLGGSTSPWARGTLVLAAGLLLLLLPPRQSPGWKWIALAGGLLASLLTAFLPWKVGPLFGWRASALELGIALPETLTPQPWLSVEAVAQIAAGLVFALALAAQRWDRDLHRAAVRTYGGGMILLALVAIGAQLAKWHVPWWPATGNSVSDFGFFPNRNQTANVLALGSIVVLGLAFSDLSRRRWTGYAWGAGLLALGVALVETHSRAGVALLFLGAGAWIFFPLRFSAAKKGVVLGLAALALLVTLFLLFGGRTLARWQAPGGTGFDTGRAQIHAEARRLANAQPWTGHGAGTFERIFAITREPGPDQGALLHPESDWLWLATESGWPAVALVVLALLLWAWETRPFDSGSGRYLRSAAAVAVVAFAAHGLMDVSGHRMGALWPALLLMALARNWRAHPPGAAESRLAAAGFRLLGLALLALGGWWLTAALRPERALAYPTSATLAWRERASERALAEGDPATALRHAEEGLRIQPLNWSLHYQRGAAIGTARGELVAVADAFTRARFLQPRYARLTFTEGLYWLDLDEVPMAIDAWTETLRRAGPAAAGPLFNDMIGRGWKRSEMRLFLANMARPNPGLLLTWLAWAAPLEVELEIARQLEADPDLTRWTEAQRRGLFELWARGGHSAALVDLVRRHPDWMPEAWHGLARHYAATGDYERAWRFVAEYAPAPILPQINTGKSVAELERSFLLQQDVLDGVALVMNLRNLRQNEEAMKVLQEVARLPNRPDYLGYLEAKMWAERNDWKAAWEAWERFAAAKK